LCGKDVPVDADKCPHCSTEIDRAFVRRELDKIIQRRLMRKIREKEDEGAPEPDLSETPIPEVKVTCPSCAMELTGSEGKCPRCGIPLVPEHKMMECPECGAVIAEGAASCPKCAVSFGKEDEEPPAPAEPEAMPPAAPAPPKKPERPKAEAVTVVTPEPSPVGGRGLTNGRGAINGTGLVNGTGMINGTRGDERVTPSAKRRGMGVVRWQFLAVLIALVIIIPTFIYLSYSKEDSGFSVDGNFGEWDGLPAFSMEVLTTTPLTVIEEWSVSVENTRVFFFVQAAGDIFGTTSVESLFLFVDSDGDADSGYMVGALGAEFLIELDGWNDTVQSSDVSEYASATDRYNWNMWESIGGAASRLDGDRLEASGDLREIPSDDAMFMLASQDQLERGMVSSGVPADGGVLIVEQRLSPSVPLSGIVPMSASVPLLTLEFTCDGTGGTVSSVDIETSHSLAGNAVQSFSLEEGESRTVSVYLNTLSASPGDMVFASVVSDDIESSFSSVIVLGHPAKAYVDSPPEDVIIDGAFGDWYGRTVSDVDSAQVVNPNIDVNEVSVYNTSVSSSFYISVDGEICSGSYIPTVRSKPVPGDGGVIPLPTRKTAEDITWIYIDSDMSATTGALVTIDSKLIGADYRIEVRGLFGEVVSTSLCEYAGSAWAVTGTTVSAEVNDQEMEVGVLSAGIGGVWEIDFIIQTTDWREVTDFVGLDEATMMALTGGISISASTSTWLIHTSSSTDATSASCQRKLFYDGTNFWGFFWDGSNTMYRYSADGGLTWVDRGRVFTTATGVNRMSVWYDSANQIVYVVGDTSSSTNYVNVRRGLVGPGTSSISWGSEATIWTSTYPYANKYSFITKASDGYLWVVTTSKVHTAQSQFNLRVNRSASADSLAGTWTDMGNLLSPWSSVDSGRAVLVPGKTGSDIVMWAAYSTEGQVDSRTHDGSGWSSVTELYAAGSSTDNTLNAPPSAVIDSEGVVHVVYGTGDMSGPDWRARIQYVYSTGDNTYSTPITLNDTTTSENKCPTISLDNSTGNVFAMWLQGTDIIVKKNLSGTWSQISVTQTAYVKSHLTSIYSVEDGEYFICWMWTQNTTGQRPVLFDKVIPEFSDLVIPVLFIMTLFIVVNRRRSRRDIDL
jgi:hypothetical protein